MRTVTRLRAGAARREITSTAKGVRGRDPLSAKALVLDNGRTRLVLLTLDTTAIGAAGSAAGSWATAASRSCPGYARGSFGFGSIVVPA